MRPALPALVLAALLGACAGSPPATPTAPADGGHEAHGDASGAPATPHPSVPAGADGSIDLVADFAIGGSGVRTAQALAALSSQPVLLTGVVLRDADGGIWFCDELDPAATPPTCGSPRLWVLDFPTDGSVFDPANASSTGVRTQGDVTWVSNQQLFGVVHPAP